VGLGADMPLTQWQARRRTELAQHAFSSAGRGTLPRLFELRQPPEPQWK
jgi:hypothetical protein